MSLTPQIFYNNQKDAFEGFATTKTIKFADYVLVFMIKGIKRNFKQPVTIEILLSRNITNRYMQRIKAMD
uniref:SFRICE_034897 n=1 Tax=Spodoptera frugiperda TaxID=7108 RepID=A0A2H1WLM8_SPOFR